MSDLGYVKLVDAGNGTSPGSPGRKIPSPLRYLRATVTAYQRRRKTHTYHQLIDDVNSVDFVETSNAASKKTPMMAPVGVTQDDSSKTPTKVSTEKSAKANSESKRVKISKSPKTAMEKLVGIFTKSPGKKSIKTSTNSTTSTKTPTEESIAASANKFLKTGTETPNITSDAVPPRTPTETPVKRPVKTLGSTPILTPTNRSADTPRNGPTGISSVDQTLTEESTKTSVATAIETSIEASTEEITETCSGTSETQPRRRFHADALPAELRALIIDKLSFADRASLMRTSRAFRNAVKREGIVPKRVHSMYIEVSGQGFSYTQSRDGLEVLRMEAKPAYSHSAIFKDLPDGRLQETSFLQMPQGAAKRFIAKATERAQVGSLVVFDNSNRTEKRGIWRVHKPAEDELIRLTMQSIDKLKIYFKCFNRITALLDAFKNTRVNEVTIEQMLCNDADSEPYCRCRKRNVRTVQKILLDHPVIARANHVDLCLLPPRAHIGKAGQLVYRRLNPLALRHRGFSIDVDYVSLEKAVQDVLDEKLDASVEQLVLKCAQPVTMLNAIGSDLPRNTHQLSKHGHYVVSFGAREVRVLRAAIFDALPDHLKDLKTRVPIVARS